MSSQEVNRHQLFPQFWNITHRKNIFFTGQKEVLEILNASFREPQPWTSTNPLIIYGLGGVGKTQIVLEYAYRSRHIYHAIMWAQATSRADLISSYTTIAALLKLPQKEEENEFLIVSALKSWMQTHRNWLLILDNVDDPSVVLEEFIPPVFSGHIILTTRASILGSLGRSIELKTMTLEEGTLLLLRRAKRIHLDLSLDNATPSDTVEAMKIVKELGGLPLAIDQAGAYIDETQLGFSDYLDLYKKERLRVLQPRVISTIDRSDQVATTWSISFKKLTPSAVELLQLCAFLYPDGIPKKIITQGAPQLSLQLQALAIDQLAFNEAIGALHAYSLINRSQGSSMLDTHSDNNGDTTILSIHRLVQAAIQDDMGRENYQLWTNRAVNALNEVFPSLINFETRRSCEQLLSNAQTCVRHAKEIGIKTLELTQLLSNIGKYLLSRCLYTEAEVYLQYAQEVQEDLLGLEHQTTTWGKVNLARLFLETGRYEEAKQLLLQALEIQERILDSNHLTIATSKTQLAWVCYVQGEYRDAETLFVRALEIRKRTLGIEDVDTATSLADLAWIYYVQGKYEDVEPLYLRALAVHQEKLGIEDLHTARDQNNLALLYILQGKYAEADIMLKHAVKIREQWNGPDHIALAVSMHNLGWLNHLQGKYVEASYLYEDALKIRKQRSGLDHPETARTMSLLGSLYCLQGRLTDAEPLLLHSLDVHKYHSGMKNAVTADSMVNLAKFYKIKGKFKESEELFQQAIEIYEKSVTATQYDRIVTLRDYSDLLKRMNRDAEALDIEAQIPSKQ